ncbi:hypothetical protein CYMTET_29887, partial [Cymbomonas tetramitiformis]
VMMAFTWLVMLATNTTMISITIVVTRHVIMGVTWQVVLSTNVAETSITIEDVGLVIDTARMKETRYDPVTRMVSLEDVPVPRACAKQRAGRAGRVRAGVCLHLMTRHTHDAVIRKFQSPEVRRVPLEQLVLRIKANKFAGNAAHVCRQLLDPPMKEAVERAVEHLTALGVLQQGVAEGGAQGAGRMGSHAPLPWGQEACPMGGEEGLTALGEHLAQFPVDAAIGKLIVLGALFGVVDESLTIAAALSLPSPFMCPMDKREEAQQKAMQFAEGFAAGSDHLAMLVAYAEFDARRGGLRYEYCRDNFLSVRGLQNMAALKRQLLEVLSDRGFVPAGLRAKQVELLGQRQGGVDGVRAALEAAGAYQRYPAMPRWVGDAPLPPPVKGGGEGLGKSEEDDAFENGIAPVLAKERREGEPSACQEKGSKEATGQGEGGGGGGGEAGNAPLLQALLCGALYPNVAKVVVAEKEEGGGKKRKRERADEKRDKIFVGASEEGPGKMKQSISRASAEHRQSIGRDGRASAGHRQQSIGRASAGHRQSIGRASAEHQQSIGRASADVSQQSIRGQFFRAATPTSFVLLNCIAMAT